MTNDEDAIRKLIDTWLTARKAGDLSTVLTLMSDDVIFMVPGQKPFGKQEFAARFQAVKQLRMVATSNIEEIRVVGDWAYLRNHLAVTVTPEDGGLPIRRSGYTLTILRKETAGNWVLVRDANLLTAEGS